MDFQNSRVIFLDNLRYLFVLFVVIWHTANAYNGMDWWPVIDRPNPVIGIVTAFFDAVAMSILFYIAGCFAIPSIQRKNVAGFLKGKLKRLGVPWLVCITAVCPALPLVYHYTRSGFELKVSYAELWLAIMKDMVSFKVGLINSMNDLMRNTVFYQRYMWFISLLLLFFVLFAVVYQLRKHWFDSRARKASPAKQGIAYTFRMFFGIGLLTFLLSSFIIVAMEVLIKNVDNPEPLLTLGNIIQFPPSRIFIYLVYFALGILTFRNGWLETGKYPGHLKTWGILFLVNLAAFFTARHYMLFGPPESKMVMTLAFWLFLNFLIIATLGAFCSYAIYFWNYRSAFHQVLADNSYNIYLSHYGFVVLFQLILLGLPGIPSLAKFSLVSISSVICSYLISRHLIKPHPRLTVVAVSAVFLVMILSLRP